MPTDEANLPATRVPNAALSAPGKAPQRATYDLIILGGGSAGLSAAPLAAALGARVLLIDRERLGGECLYTGCVPSKALLHIAHTAAAIRHATSLGLDARLEGIDGAAVDASVRRAIHTIEVESDSPEHFTRRGVEVVFGATRFVAPTTLELNGATITARRFLITTGSRPRIPEIPGLADVSYLTNESLFELRRLPSSLVVLGAGPIGVEMAQAFARLGATVTLLEGEERILPREDPDASQILHVQLEVDGVTIQTGAQVSQASVREGHTVVRMRAPTGEQEVVAEDLLIATGRVPNLEGLGLEAASVRYDPRDGIAVDAHLRTTNPRIYAAGDVIGGNHLTHAAAKEAFLAVRNALLPRVLHQRLDERVMPWATFTEPEVARVGLGEAEARARHAADVAVYTQPYRAVDRAIADGATAGFVKLIAMRQGKLLGAQIVGPHAGDTINELALAMQTGATLAQLAATTHAYPTYALAIQQAAGQHTFGQLATSRLVHLLRLPAR